MGRPFGRPGYNRESNRCVNESRQRALQADAAPASEQTSAPPAAEAEAEPEPLELIRGENGRLICPQCLSSSMVTEDGFCNRCVGWLAALSVLPGKHYPDF